MYDDIVNLNKMISAGAYGYLLKSVDKEELCFAIRKVKKGEKHFSTAVTLENVLEKKKKKLKETYFLEDLSSREREILHQLARGKSSNDISKDLHISIRTVETHRANIMKKVGVHNTSGLVRYAYSIGIS
jgi:DNA-binding NarL/FixJ family response regulator